MILKHRCINLEIDRFENISRKGAELKYKSCRYNLRLCDFHWRRYAAKLCARRICALAYWYHGHRYAIAHFPSLHICASGLHTNNGKVHICCILVRYLLHKTAFFKEHYRTNIEQWSKKTGCWYGDCIKCYQMLSNAIKCDHHCFVYRLLIVCLWCWAVVGMQCWVWA